MICIQKFRVLIRPYSFFVADFKNELICQGVFVLLVDYALHFDAFLKVLVKFGAWHLLQSVDHQANLNMHRFHLIFVRVEYIVNCQKLLKIVNQLDVLSLWQRDLKRYWSVVKNVFIFVLKLSF